MTNNGERHLRAVHEDWRSVATALGARMSTQRVSQQELALAAGVSVATLRVLQRGNGDRRVQNSTLSAVSRALDWPDDHLVRVLLGDQYPELATGEGPAPGARVTRQAAVTARPDLPEQILHALRRIERRVDDIARHLVKA
ncbi:MULTISPECIES: helix-turn-helix transcriptional regulator [unclassified Pseudofrankia]|uniref:helix-turn-helix domain-containing protein n=1 Tax=unclassified Pseudofrankia TaxID=2994372 RepID=UPI0008DA673C|nr:MULTISPECIES: hypothetical protein [unclassified Pseudofrankia]MDT3443675.1 hypothetical protein [Pseudofrankia sp. BMG5.37]OHV42926.1 hypothetical protein BCD48_29480 [Pseudofrankia sp. BMG5.36]